MNIVINDASILIDLIEIDLIDSFWELPFIFCTTDFVANEIKSEKGRTAINTAIGKGKIEIYNSSTEQLGKINEIFNSSKGISFQDSSVFYFAKEKHAILLTGDKNLKIFTESFRLTSHGIIWIFDKLFEHNILTPPILVAKMKELLDINSRLPREICLNRIKDWEGM